MTTLQCKACNWSFILERQKFIAEIGSHSTACPKCGSLATIKVTPDMVNDASKFDRASLGKVQESGAAGASAGECPVCATPKRPGHICPKCYPHTTGRTSDKGLVTLPAPGQQYHVENVVIVRTCQTCLYGTPLVFKEQRLQKGKPEDVSMVRCRRFPRHETMPPEETCGEWKGKVP